MNHKQASKQKFLDSRFWVLDSRRGQVLVEAIVALSVLTIGFLGILTILARSLGLNRVISDNYTGTYLAAEGIELIKSAIDYNIIARNAGAVLAWNQGICDTPTGAYEIDYRLAPLDLGAARIGPATVASTRKLRYDPNFYYQYDNGEETIFVRTVRVDCTRNRDGNEIAVNSIVSWVTRGGAEFSVDLEDHFFNWY